MPLGETDPLDGSVTSPTEGYACTGNGMSMADDPKLRSYRSNDPYRQAGEPSRPSEQASDPLAELARLIGQKDPFAEFGRSNSRQAARRTDDAPTTAPDDWRYASAREPQFTADSSASRETYGSSEDYAQPTAHEPEGWRSDPPLHEPVHEEVPLAADHQGQYHGDGLHQAAQYDDRMQDGQEANYDYQDDVPLEPHEDEMYDDPPGARRRSALVTALALIGCAMLGTAGAYGYRSYYSEASSTQPPPVITADSSTPTKIVPATAGDPQSGKAVQDRLTNAEQLVSKQEEPVALKELAAQASRAAPPAPAAPPPSGSVAQQPSATSPAGTGEPKKVRTVTIRPDGGDMSGRPVGAPPPAAPAPAAATTAAPRPLTPPAPRAVPAQPQASPQASEPATAPAARTRTATAPTSSAESAPSGFVVQLSSQKTESEAQAAFRSLQAKFPTELGGRQPIIRRADLGAKGVFYRTLVGPFASAQDASQFCANYKAAGGQCVVPTN